MTLFEAPVVRPPRPVPGLPPVMAAKPSFPAETASTMPASIIVRVSWSSRSRPAKPVGPPRLMFTTSMSSEL